MDPPEELQKKVDRLAEWFRESKHTIAFTVSGWLQPGAQGRGMCAVDMCSTVFPHRELASVHLLEVSVLYQPQNTHSLPLLLLLLPSFSSLPPSPITSLSSSPRLPQWYGHSAGDRAWGLGAEGKRSDERYKETQSDNHLQSHSDHHSHVSGQAP